MISAGKEWGGAVASDGEVGALAPEWAKRLAEAASDVGLVARSTSDDFLALRGRLQELYQRGMGLSALASEIVGQITGEGATAADRDLRAMLDEMERYVNRSRDDIGCSSETLREVLVLLDKVAEPLSGFKKVNKVLRMLGISTKIESARLGQSAAGFDTLASDVGELSVQVNDKAAIIMRRKDELAAAIEQTLTKVLDSGARQHVQVEAILEKTRQRVEMLTDINARCSGSMAEISAMADDVSGGIGKIVIAAEANDTAGRQLQGVEQALSGLKERLSSGLAGADEAVPVCQAQGTELEQAASVLDAAVAGVADSLSDVAGKLNSISSKTAEVAALATQTSGGFFSGIQKDITVVGQALQATSQADRTLAVAMASVAETVEEIASFVGDIETIGEEIKLIALNAQIKSAYTGEEGAALGVLAEAIQRLSVDAIEHTGSVSALLQSITSVTERLREGGGEQTSGSEDAVGEMVATLSSLLEAVDGANASLQNSLAGVEQEVGSQISEVEQLTEAVSAHGSSSQALSRAAGEVRGIFEEARAAAPAFGEGRRSAVRAGRCTQGGYTDDSTTAAGSEVNASAA